MIYFIKICFQINTLLILSLWRLISISFTLFALSQRIVVWGLICILLLKARIIILGIWLKIGLLVELGWMICVLFFEAITVFLFNKSDSAILRFYIFISINLDISWVVFTKCFINKWWFFLVTERRDIIFCNNMFLYFINSCIPIVFLSLSFINIRFNRCTSLASAIRKLPQANIDPIFDSFWSELFMGYVFINWLALRLLDSSY